MTGLGGGEEIAGPSRQFEPSFANILDLGLLAQYDQGVSSNAQLGFDVDTRVHRTHLFTQFLLDDIQIDRGGAGNKKPPLLGFTMGAQRGGGLISWTAVYTVVTNPPYRTPDPTQTGMRRRVGLGRHFP